MLEEADSLGRVVNDYGLGDSFHIAVLTRKPLPLNGSVESIPGKELGYWVNLTIRLNYKNISISKYFS